MKHQTNDIFLKHGNSLDVCRALQKFVIKWHQMKMKFQEKPKLFPRMPYLVSKVERNQANEAFDFSTNMLTIRVRVLFQLCHCSGWWLRWNTQVIICQFCRRNVIQSYGNQVKNHWLLCLARMIQNLIVIAFEYLQFMPESLNLTLDPIQFTFSLVQMWNRYFLLGFSCHDIEIPITQCWIVWMLE